MKLRNLTLAGMLAACLGVAALASAAPAGAAAEHYDTTARAAIPAAGADLVDGDGADLPVVAGAHGTAMYTDTSGTTFTQVASGGYTELKASNGQCATVNSGEHNAVYNESCSGSEANEWVRDGTLWQSVLLIGEGVTGNMMADPAGSCTSTGEPILAQGGTVTACHYEWAGA